MIRYNNDACLIRYNIAHHLTLVITVLLFQEMDHVLPVKCNAAKPQIPINVGAYPVSDKIILVVWDKPLGDGYRYKVTVDDGGQNRTSVSGEQGFGNAGLHEIFLLTEDTNYTVSVQLECKDHRGTFSQPATTVVTTLPAGKLIWRLFGQVKFNNHSLFAI